MKVAVLISMVLAAGGAFFISAALPAPFGYLVMIALMVLVAYAFDDIFKKLWR